MHRIVRGSTHGLSDLDRFIEGISDADRSGGLVFDPAREVIVARAPGRLDLMGGIADYSGSLVLQLPIAESAIVAVQRDASPTIAIVSVASMGPGHDRHFSMPLGEFVAGGVAVDYETAREYFNRDEDGQWAAYVAGAFLILMRELGVSLRRRGAGSYRFASSGRQGRELLGRR